MKKKNTYHSMRNLMLVLCLAMSGVFTSCNFLRVDDYFDDTMKFDSIFVNYNNLVRYMWGITDMMPDESKLFADPYGPGPLATDEAFTGFDPNSRGFFGLRYVLGQVNADNVWATSFNIWGRMYQVIRKCNYILSRKHEAGLTTLQENEIRGYTHMLRGYAYYHLIRFYGPCIILGDDILPNNELPAAYNYSRSTFDECVDYCCEELEQAAKYLSPDISSTYYGRPGRGAAFALIARLRLMQASPLFNGGQAARTTYGNWKRSVDGVHYISQQYDERRWAVAAAAFKRVIDMDKYELHTVPSDESQPQRPFDGINVPLDAFPDGVGGIDCYRSYSDMFTGESIGSKNKEFIWGREFWSGDVDVDLHLVFPTTAVMGGWNGLCVTQKLVDAYYMVDGRDKNNASEKYPYNVAQGSVTDDNFSKTVETFSGYKIPVGVYGMYLNRENRFYATVGFSGRYWSVNSNTEASYGPYNVWYEERSTSGQDLYSGKYAAKNVANDYPATGYVLTKYVHPDDALAGNGSSFNTKYYAIIRYAEVLLGYAEALNHLNSSYTVELPSINGGNKPADTYTLAARDKAEISKYFNQIRYRVGLPGLSEEDMADETTLDRIIQREYFIEFACENHRYWDVRRWGIYEETEKAGIYGMHLGEDRYGYYQTPIPVDQVNNRKRVIDKKLILLPIPKSEVRRVENLDQNPGWES